MCERVWRNAQDCTVKQGLIAGSRRWLTTCKPPKGAHEWSMQRSWTLIPVIALQDKKSSLAIQLVHGLDSRLSQVARPSRQFTLLWKNWLFAFLSHSSINTLYTHKILRASGENFKREKQDWLIHNLYIVTLQKNSSTLTLSICYILERFISQNFSHHIHICEKDFWCFGKQFGRNQFILVDAMGYSRIW